MGKTYMKLTIESDGDGKKRIVIDGKVVASGLRQKDVPKKLREVLKSYE